MSSDESQNDALRAPTSVDEGELSSSRPRKAVKKKSAKKVASKRAGKTREKNESGSAPGEVAPAQGKASAGDSDDEVTFSGGIKVDDVKESDEREAGPERDDRPNRQNDNDRGASSKSGHQGHQGDQSNSGSQKGGGGPKGPHPKDRKGGKPFNKNNKNKRKRGKNRWGNKAGPRSREEDTPIELGDLLDWELLEDVEGLIGLADQLASGGSEALDYYAVYAMELPELRAEAERLSVKLPNSPNRDQLINGIAAQAAERQQAIRTRGVLELLDEDDGGLIVYERDSYRIKALSAYVPQSVIDHYGLQRGHIVEAQLQPHREGESCPVAVRIYTVMGHDPESVSEIVPFTERVPYYPTSRILLESDSEAKWDNLSMRVVDCLTPVGFGQRGLIVAPPRTGKTVLMQGMANSIQKNYPNAHLIILLIDERPEEVTDFRRQVKGEVISSTFDESAESHVHAAEMVIEKARRMVEVGEDVVILLDSVTRLARAYNTTMPNSGKILSGGVEANALQKPKRFFGSARNIEDGGSLTIIATALVETGSKMDEVIFEEFKGTGNMELHLDRGLSDKRIFPALSMDKSGTRKEELLYHPDEMLKIYSLRRAMKGLPSTDAMEMLIQRIKKTNTNAEFLMSVAR
jgi:transcription termination factor Rho